MAVMAVSERQKLSELLKLKEFKDPENYLAKLGDGEVKDMYETSQRQLFELERVEVPVLIGYFTENLFGLRNLDSNWVYPIEDIVAYVFLDGRLLYLNRRGELSLFDLGNWSLLPLSKDVPIGGEVILELASRNGIAYAYLGWSSVGNLFVAYNRTLLILEVVEGEEVLKVGKVLRFKESFDWNFDSSEVRDLYDNERYLLTFEKFFNPRHEAFLIDVNGEVENVPTTTNFVEMGGFLLNIKEGELFLRDLETFEVLASLSEEFLDGGAKLLKVTEEIFVVDHTVEYPNVCRISGSRRKGFKVEKLYNIPLLSADILIPRGLDVMKRNYPLPQVGGVSTNSITFVPIVERERDYSLEMEEEIDFNPAKMYEDVAETPVTKLRFNDKRVSLGMKDTSEDLRWQFTDFLDSRLSTLSPLIPDLLDIVIEFL